MLRTKVKFHSSVPKLNLNHINKRMNQTSSTNFIDLALNTTRQMSDQDLFKLKSYYKSTVDMKTDKNIPNSD